MSTAGPQPSQGEATTPVTGVVRNRGASDLTKTGDRSTTGEYVAGHGLTKTVKRIASRLPKVSRSVLPRHRTANGIGKGKPRDDECYRPRDLT